MMQPTDQMSTAESHHQVTTRMDERTLTHYVTQEVRRSTGLFGLQLQWLCHNHFNIMPHLYSAMHSQR